MDTSLTQRNEDAPGSLANSGVDGRVGAARQGAEWNVLIVDDEPAVQGFVERVLTRQGYRCTKAVNASEAIAFAMNDAPDLTISDIRMPGSDGTWLLGELKQRYPDMAVIMLTAVAEATTAVDCVKAGADDFLVKPINMDELVVSVERALEGVALRRSNAPSDDGAGERLSGVTVDPAILPASREIASRRQLDAGAKAASDSRASRVNVASLPERLTREIALFQELASTDDASSEVGSSVKRVLDTLPEVIDYEVSGLLMLGAQPTFIAQTRVVVEEDFVGELKTHVLNIAKLTCGIAIDAGVDVAVTHRDDAAPERVSSGANKQLLRSMIEIPLTVDEEVVGLLHLSSSKENAFTAADPPCAERIATFLASKVEASRTALPDERGQLALAVEQMADGVVTLDERGAILSVNETARAILDVKPGAEVWLDLPRLTTILDFDPLALVASGRREQPRRVTVKGVSYQVLLTPVRRSNGTPGGVIAVFRKSSRKQK